MASPLSALIDGTVFGAAQINPVISRVNTAMVVCTSTTRPASPSAGDQIQETDTGRQMWFDGSAWRGIRSVLYTANPTAGTTSGGSELTVASLSIPAQGCVGNLLISAQLYASKTVTSDAISCFVKSGPTAFGQSRDPAVSAQLMQNISTVITVPSAATVTSLTMTMQRVSGSGTASAYSDTTLARLTALFIPT